MKNFIQWNYERGTWQYDIFCLLIVALIFLTPKEWFNKRERLATQTARLVVKADDLPVDEKQRNQRIRELSGIADIEGFEMHERKNAVGEVFYEIDIR